MKSAAAEDDSLLDTVRRFACAELAPRAAALDEGGSAAEHLPRLAALGLLGMNLPGAGRCWPNGAFASGRGGGIARAGAATASMVTANFLAADAILLAGDDAICERYLPAAAAGRALGAFALTEPQTGSNPLDMATSATPEGDGVRLRGVKHFISNGGIADFIVVFAKPTAAGARGIDAFVLDKGIFGRARQIRSRPWPARQPDLRTTAGLPSVGGAPSGVAPRERHALRSAPIAAEIDVARWRWHRQRGARCRLGERAPHDGHPLRLRASMDLADMATELAAARR
jgi:alkylation response protein AidB-like acyl-CoA dehydrogenase